MAIGSRLGIYSGSGSNFISEWTTTNSGVSSSNQISLPLVSTGNYNFNVNWGDSNEDTITAWNDAAVTHTYSTSGTYVVTINGTIEGFRFNNGGDKSKIIDIKKWGPLKFLNQTGAFYGCDNLTGTATDYPDVSSVVLFSNWFRGASLWNGVMNDWDMSSGTNISDIFHDASSFNKPLNLWDTSGFTVVDRAFEGATAFNSNIAPWDMSSVTSAINTFDAASSFNIDISGWDVSSIARFDRFLRNATSFDQDLGPWSVVSATNMTAMLSGVTLSTSNYDSLLIGWEGESVNDSVSFHGGSSQYSAGAATTARTNLINDHSWTIADGGQA